MEGFPRPDALEKQPVKLTTEEFDKIRNYGGRFEDPAFVKLLQEKGITLNNGPLEIEVDGKRMEIVTDSHDFGTVIDK